MTALKRFWRGQGVVNEYDDTILEVSAPHYPRVAPTLASSAIHRCAPQAGAATPCCGSEGSTTSSAP